MDHEAQGGILCMSSCGSSTGGQAHPCRRPAHRAPWAAYTATRCTKPRPGSRENCRPNWSPSDRKRLPRIYTRDGPTTNPVKTAERKLETTTHAALLRHWQKQNKGAGIGGEGATPYRTDGRAKQLVKKRDADGEWRAQCAVPGFAGAVPRDHVRAVTRPPFCGKWMHPKEIATKKVRASVQGGWMW